MSSRETITAGGDRITYVGHATVLFELAGQRLLTDPVLRSNLLLVIRRQAAPPKEDVSQGIDAVLISHLHADHLDFPSLRKVGKDTLVIAPRGAGRTLARRGFHNLVELDPGEFTTVGAVEVRATEASHEGRRWKMGPPVEALGYEVRGHGHRLYFAGDTDLFEGMQQMAGSLDVALLPVSGWGPRIRSGHLDPRRAAQAAAILQPRLAVPIHWGTLLRADLARRRPDVLIEPARAFAARVYELAPHVETRVLAPGGTLSLH
jgi:L-ascorbate metabolism protein UlaG (beta-lactamase superfamily)